MRILIGKTTRRCPPSPTTASRPLSGWLDKPLTLLRISGKYFLRVIHLPEKVILLRKTREKYSEVFLLQAGCEQAAHRERPPAFLGSAQPRRRHQVQENDNFKIFSRLSMLSFNSEHKGSSMIGWRTVYTGKGGLFQFTKIFNQILGDSTWTKFNEFSENF